MCIKKNVLKLTVMAVSIISASAFAEGYVGFDAGQAMFGDANLSSPEGSGDWPINQNAFSARVYAGYNFNEYFGTEVVAGNIGSVGVQNYPVENDLVNIEIESIKYISLQPKLAFPVTEKFSIFAKAGVGFSFIEAKASIADAPNQFVKYSDSTFSTAFGLGSEYLITDRLSARVNWEYTAPVVDLSEQTGLDVTLNIQQIYAGINYRF